MGNSKVMMIVILAVLLVLIGTIVAGVLLIIRNMDSITVEGGTTEIFIYAPPALAEADIVPVPIGGAITTNLLTGPGEGNRFARLDDPAIGINNLDPTAAEEFIEVLIEREVVVRDIITNILRRTTAEQLNSLGGDDLLREEIMAALQDAFRTHLIVRIYFSPTVQ